MCVECWKNYGSPQINTTIVLSGLKIVQRLYEIHCTGGRLHVVTDDYNLEDGYVEFAIKEIDSDPNYWADDFGDELAQEACEVERHCANYLARLTVEERASVLALRAGYWVAT